jgi:hypothetical protein
MISTISGHSLGGVLVRAALAMLPPNTRQPFWVFLLGSPMQSTRLARMLQRNPIYRLLSQDCSQVLASDERMQEIGPVVVPTTGIFGVCGIGVVSIAEVSAPWLTDQVRVPVVHTFVPASGQVAVIILAKMGMAALDTATY